MKWLAVFVVCLFAVGVSGSEICKAGPLWSYCTGSAIGPAQWAGLSPEWRACNGSNPAIRQSPIRIPDSATLAPDLGPLTLHYGTIPLTVTNTSQVLKIPVPQEADQYFELGEGARKTQFVLEEFHFHVPAEHVVMNVPAVGELHLVHRARGGSAAAAIAIRLVLAADGNAELQPIVAAIPGTPLCGAANGGKLDLRALVAVTAPASFTSYAGSLTTPDCSVVRWFILPSTIAISAAQRNALDLFGGNARPIQSGAGVTVHCWPASPRCNAGGDHP